MRRLEFGDSLHPIDFKKLAIENEQIDNENEKLRNDLFYFKDKAGINEYLNNFFY